MGVWDGLIKKQKIGGDLEKMPEKESKHRTTIIFDKELFIRAKHYVIDKKTSMNALLESLLQKELDAHEKKE